MALLLDARCENFTDFTSTVNTGGSLTVQSTTKFEGTNAIKLLKAPTAAADYLQYTWPSGSVAYTRTYWRFHTAPTSSSNRAIHSNANGTNQTGIVRFETTGLLRGQLNGGSVVQLVTPANVAWAPSADTWYVIETMHDVSGTTHTFEIRVSSTGGTLLASILLTATSTATTIQRVRWPDSSTADGGTETYYDAIAASDTDWIGTLSGTRTASATLSTTSQLFAHATKSGGVVSGVTVLEGYGWNLDSSNSPAYDLTQITNRGRFVVGRKGNESDAASLKSSDPTRWVVCYWLYGEGEGNATGMYQYGDARNVPGANFTPLQNQPFYQAGDWQTVLNSHNDYFLYTAGGQRLYEGVGSRYFYHLDLTNVAVQDLILNRLLSYMTANASAWTGWHMDNIIVNYGKLTSEATNHDGTVNIWRSGTISTLSEATYRAAVANFLQRLQAAAHSIGHTFGGNLITAAATNTAWDQYLPYLDHATDEVSSLKEAANGGFTSTTLTRKLTQWGTALNTYGTALFLIMRDGGAIGSDPAPTPDAYATAMIAVYFLITDGRATFLRITNKGAYNEDWRYYNNYATLFGAPTGAWYVKSDGVTYRRDFANGYVEVLPGASPTGTLTITGTLKQGRSTVPTAIVLLASATKTSSVTPSSGSGGGTARGGSLRTRLRVTLLSAPGGALLLDATPYLTAGEISTDAHGYHTASLSLQLSQRQSVALYVARGVPWLQVTAGAETVWEGRVEDVALTDTGVDLTAYGAWQALTDVPYTALWSSTSVDDWTPVTAAQHTWYLPERYAIDTNNRLYIAPRKNELFSDQRRGGVSYAIPAGSGRAITRFSASYAVTGTDTQWFATVSGAADDFTGLTPLWSLASANGTQLGTISLSGLNVARIVVHLYVNVAGFYSYTGETGSTAFQLTNVRVQTSSAASVYADDIARDLLSSVRAVNSSQLAASTAALQSPGVDLTDAVYDDQTPAEILAALVERAGDASTPWEVGVYEGQRLYLRPRGSAGRSYQADQAALTIQRSLAQLTNSAYAVYERADRTPQRTATASNTRSVTQWGLTRRAAISTKTTSAGLAAKFRDAAVADGADPQPRTDVAIAAISANDGTRVPRWRVRSGDTLTVRALAPQPNLTLDRVRTFRLAETRYNLMTDELTVVPESPLPTLDWLLARD